VKPVNGARLPDVERLARRRLARGVDEQYAVHAIARGKRLRGGAAEIAGADDRHGAHCAWSIVMR
jgi:hypothetical protein